MIDAIDWTLLRLAAIAGIVFAARYASTVLRLSARFLWSLASAADAISPAFRSAWNRFESARTLRKEVA